MKRKAVTEEVAYDNGQNKNLQRKDMEKTRKYEPTRPIRKDKEIVS